MANQAAGWEQRERIVARPDQNVAQTFMSADVNPGPKDTLYSWLRSIPLWLQVMSGLAALLGAVIGVWVTFVVDERVPEVTNIVPTETAPGGQVNILGKNLELVEEVFLSRGDSRPVLLIFQMREDEARLTIEVHQFLQSGNYVLGFQLKMGTTSPRDQL